MCLLLAKWEFREKECSSVNTYSRQQREREGGGEDVGGKVKNDVEKKVSRDGDGYIHVEEIHAMDWMY